MAVLAMEILAVLEKTVSAGDTQVVEVADTALGASAVIVLVVAATPALV